MSHLPEGFQEESPCKSECVSVARPSEAATSEGCTGLFRQAEGCKGFQPEPQRRIRSSGLGVIKKMQMSSWTMHSNVVRYKKQMFMRHTCCELP